MSVYIPGAKIPNGDYVRVLMLHKEGTCVDGIGNVFKAIPVPPHGRLGDLDELYVSLKKWLIQNRHSMTEATRVWVRGVLEGIAAAPTIIPAEEGE